MLLNRSMWETEKEHLTLLVFPPENDKSSCITIEMGTLTGTCPKTLCRYLTNRKENFTYYYYYHYSRSHSYDS